MTYIADRFAMDSWAVPDPMHSIESLWKMTPLMSKADGSLELVIGIYEKEETSKWVLRSLEQLQQEAALVLVSTAILIETQAGKLLTRQIVDWNLTESGLIDGLTAALVSLFNPVGHLGALAFNCGGLSVEVLLEHLDEMGLSRKELQLFGENIAPDSSILIVLTQRPWVNRLMTEMAYLNIHLMRKTLNASLKANLGDHLISLAQAVVLEQSQQTHRFQLPGVNPRE